MCLTGVAIQHNKSPAQVLIRWSLQKGFVPLPKASSAHRIEENFKVYDFALDAGDMAEIDALDEGASGAMTRNPVGEPRSVPVARASECGVILKHWWRGKRRGARP